MIFFQINQKYNLTIKKSLKLTSFTKKILLYQYLIQPLKFLQIHLQVLFYKFRSLINSALSFFAFKKSSLEFKSFRLNLQINPLPYKYINFPSNYFILKKLGIILYFYRSEVDQIQIYFLKIYQFSANDL